MRAVFRTGLAEIYARIARLDGAMTGLDASLTRLVVQIQRWADL